MCAHVCKREFKKLPHTVVSGQSEVCKAGQQAVDPGGVDAAEFQSGAWRQDSLFLQGHQPFSLSLQLTREDVLTLWRVIQNLLI